jgi:hypothetical protein
MIQEHILNSLTLNNKAAFRIQGARVKNQMHSMKPLTMRLLVNIYLRWLCFYVLFNQLHETRRQIRTWWHMNRSVQQSQYTPQFFLTASPKTGQIVGHPQAYDDCRGKFPSLWTLPAQWKHYQ